MSCDLLILGGGPAGFRAAERAGHFGLSVTIFEGNMLGGICLNEGCIPTKTLLYSAKLYDYAKGGAQKYGVTTTGAELDHAFVVARKDKLVQKLVAGVEMQMKKARATVVRARGTLAGRNDAGEFIVRAGDTEYTGKNVLIATGSSAAIPPIPGLREALESGFAVTNREILALREVPKRLVVLGAGAIGLEMASYFNSAGAEVTVVEMLDRIGGRLDKDASNLLQRNYTARGVKILTGCRVQKLEPGRVAGLKQDGTEFELETDLVLAAAGRKPNTAGIGLESLGIELRPNGGILTDEKMRTNVPGVFAAGDANGVSMLAHTAYREAETAVNIIRGVEDTMRYDAVPSVIYTNPEVASVGETEESARARGLNVKSLRVPLLLSGRYQAENEGGNGILKLVLDEGKRILGVTIVGNPASEIIPAAAMAVTQRMTAQEFTGTIFPHPTVAEVLRDAALMEL
ncbi:MAG: dihydrolipoyl dehydrogenase [Lentisphaeria bacterium]|nr:dihydrolipoyl dehydrogenase [Lentisphaeria bacterium]